MNTYLNQEVKRIICPFDFSPLATAGLDYAARLAAALGADLTIFYVQPASPSETLQLYEDLNDDNRAVRRHLHLEATRVEESFGVTCDYIIEPAVNETDAYTDDYDLIVMGSNGSDEVYRHVYGPNCHHSMALANCPVLIIPEGHETVSKPNSLCLVSET